MNVSRKDGAFPESRSPSHPNLFANNFVPLTKVRKWRGARAADFPRELRAAPRADCMWRGLQGPQGRSEQSWVEPISSLAISSGWSENMAGNSRQAWI